MFPLHMLAHWETMRGSTLLVVYKSKQQRSGPMNAGATRFKVLTAAFLLGATPLAASDAPTFSGKTINVIIGFGPGGGYDAYGRLLAQHLGAHLPGKPSVVARNMPGAGSLRLANHLFNASARDGTELGVFATSIALEPLFGGKGVQFDPRSFTWIGNMMKDASNIAIWRTSQVKTWQDMRARETIFGATGPGSISSIHISVATGLLGLKTRIIHGFPGTKEANLAMERGEIDGYGGLYLSALKTSYWGNIQRGDMKVVLHLGRSEIPELGSPPSIFSLLNSEEDRQVAGLIFDQDQIGRPIAAPPKVDPATAATRRKAFLSVMQDSYFLAAAAKANAPISAQSGEDVDAAFAAFFACPPQIIKRSMTLMNRD
jgi:tripartite-type tricarboxylate transporter receptor subunit TctC